CLRAVGGERPGNDVLEIAAGDGQLLAGETLAAKGSGRATYLKDAVGIEEVGSVGVAGPADAGRCRIHGEKVRQGYPPPPAGSFLSIDGRPTDSDGLRAIGRCACARREQGIIPIDVV